ncbi:hypothetical protein AOQ84DRAFT_387607 [Glonium stellatum]|uniref:Uncharacterized protein n=1 Tax=Glonium stellatum TaxID=574774 RepID=A0A8E2F4S6_9PEZI|nr:hypothetical protein AOQ84DRAFT_387607 [Glonium stellatum]
MYISTSVIHFVVYAFSLVVGTSANKFHKQRFRHEAAEALENRHGEWKRQVEPIAVEANLITSNTVYTIITPSPGAAPVKVTEQSQVVTTFVPQMTMCVGPPVALVPVTTMGPPYLNYSMIVAGNGSCSTYYTPTVTTVCATTLTGLATQIKISQCSQEVTFSSDFGYSLETPSSAMGSNAIATPAPAIKTIITYYMAPWQALTSGRTPSSVDSKLCTVLEDGSLRCKYYREVWHIQTTTVTSTTTRHVDLTTTVSGPGTLMVETIHMDITTTLASVSLSTSMLLETEIETETTSKTTLGSFAGLTYSTLYMTRTVEYAPSIKHITSTIHTIVPATTRVGTVKVTRPRLLSTPI